MKRSTFAAFRGLGLLSAARRLQRSRSLILTYHGVLSGSDNRYDFLNQNFIAATTFKEQMRCLRRHYTTVRLADLVACCHRGTAPPPQSVAVTFDDGFANNYTVAFPILQELGIPFTVFLTTDMLEKAGAQLWSERVKRAIYFCRRDSFALRLLDRDIRCDLASVAEREGCARQVLQLLKQQTPDARNHAVDVIESAFGRPPLQPGDLERYQFLTWSQVRVMADAGVEFGSHTATHPILSTLDPETLETELVRSKAHIESELGRECYAFAYPNGSRADFGEREKVALQAAGYQCGLSLEGRLNGEDADPYALDRINVGRRLTGPVFEAALAGIPTGMSAIARRMLSPVRQRAVPQQGVHP